MADSYFFNNLIGS